MPGRTTIRSDISHKSQKSSHPQALGTIIIEVSPACVSETTCAATGDTVWPHGGATMKLALNILLVTIFPLGGGSRRSAYLQRANACPPTPFLGRMHPVTRENHRRKTQWKSSYEITERLYNSCPDSCQFTPAARLTRWGRSCCTTHCTHSRWNRTITRQAVSDKILAGYADSILCRAA
jgi:hypothetical protein